MAENNAENSTQVLKRIEVKRFGYTLTFVLNQDESECYCQYQPANTGGTPLTEPELQTYLAQNKLTQGIIPEALSILIHAAATAESVHDLKLAQGIPMIPGENGKIAIVVADGLAAPPKSEIPLGEDEPEHQEKLSEVVDFKRVQAFLNVEAGDLVATIEPPGLGTPGKSVTGKIIPPQPGMPVRVELGSNIKFSDDGCKLFATATGRVCQKGDAISVEEIYEIDGDVGFKVGNINFKGYVVIKGDVLDDFNVKAVKGITATGNIGICRIESEGDISFCGMNGQQKGKITCAGSITANFIYDADIECSGNIVVETEIRNSHIRCLGSITVNKGGLVGGEYFALAGIQTGILGAVTSLHTRVVAGVNYRDLEELNTLFNDLKQLLADFNAANKGNIDMKEFARKRMLITEKTQEVRSRGYDSSNAKINVTNKLYDGVSITLGLISENIKEERKGPMSIIENSIEGGLRFLGMTPLSFNAKEIEQTFIQQHQMEENKKMSQSGE